MRIIFKSHKIHFGATTQPLFPSLDSHFSQVRISMLLFLLSLCCILSLGRRAYCRTADSARGGKARENNRSIIIPTYLFIGWDVWLWFVGRIGSYCFSYAFSLYWFIWTYVHRVYLGHVRLPTRQELQEPNHPRDVIGSHHGIFVDLLLRQSI
jgi:hypothetical protein